MRFLISILFSICGLTWLDGQTRFVDITKYSGINHQFEVYEGMFGGGAAVFDINNDGWEDIYITGGKQDDVLYLNQKIEKADTISSLFKNIFIGSGLEPTKKFITQGVVSADINKDGWQDLYITTITLRDSMLKIPRAKNLVFINNRDNTFTDVTSQWGLDRMESFSTGANFGDINADGYPDLYVGNYFQDFDGKLTTINDATIVNANRTAKGYLLINKNGKRFKDEYNKYGMNHKGFGFGGVFTDYDNDNDQDLFVNQDFGYKAIPDFLFNNQFPKRQYLDVSEKMEMDLKINSMGTAVGDIDNDGDMDYYVTNIRFNYMMINNGADNPFVNKAKELGMQIIMISWGANFADYDQDGDVDLFVANGDLNPNCVPMADFYFENKKDSFIERGRDIGLGDYGIGRGSVNFDFDNDGDQDILVVNQKPELDYPVSSFTRLYRNDNTVGHWIKIKLKGLRSETSGLGSRIELYTTSGKQIREVDGGGSSHLSQNSSVVHFGFNSQTFVDSIIVKWSGQRKQKITAINSNQLIEITQIEKAKKKFPILLIVSALFVLVSVLYLLKKDTLPGN